MRKNVIVFPLFFLAVPFTTFSTPVVANEITTLEEIVVTGTQPSSSLRNTASTIQIFNRERILQSPAASITEFLAENGVAFFSQWSPGQTSISLRGVRSDGQGRDFKGGVLVLINGRRAGTANLSKLSTNQVDRIEIIRGPASVSYGSQAMGGVINLITKNGLNTKGGKVTGQGGHFGYLKGTGEYGGALNDKFSYYVGANGETRNDVDGGDGSRTQINTAYNRYGALASLSREGHSGSFFDITVRTDGIYDAGFRGSSYDFDNVEDRYNQSIDLQHQLPVSGINALLNSHLFAFKDVDNFHWGSEAAGYDIDNIKRKQQGYGLKLAPQFNFNDNTHVVVGFDTEYSELRSTRYRYGLNGPKPQTAPYDMNQDSLVLSGYSEINQQILDKRLNWLAGIRYTHNNLSLVDTPYQTISGNTDETNSHFTYSAGISYLLPQRVKLRANYSTGFRTPTGSELAGEYTPVLTPNSITKGNPNLEPETNQQFEVGATYTSENSYLDLALFDNTIEDRINKQTIYNDGTTKISEFQNLSGDANIQGVELLYEYNFAPLLNLKEQRLMLLMNGSYNFTLDEKGKDSKDSGPFADKIQRMPEYQGSATLTYGWHRTWDISFISTLTGPMYYDTEEKLTSAAQSASNYVHKKDAYTIFNLRGNYYFSESFTLFGGINNLLDENYHPMFIQIDDGRCMVDPSKTNGGCGNSMPGINLYAGLKFTF